MGYTLKAMQVGLWALRQKLSFKEVLVEVVEAGGDTDTNGAVAGAVMGARVGLSGIPPRWRDNIRDPDYLIELADRLFDASGGPASGSADARPPSSSPPSNRKSNVTFDIADLKRRGFQGFRAISELEDNAQGLPAGSGVYVVVRDDNAEPRFLSRSPAGRFKRRDPTVRIKRLKDKWVRGAKTLYIGSATSLRERTAELVKFSRGRGVPHWGGRFLWQVECSCNFQVAWLEDENPIETERELLTEFERRFDRLPFANLRRGRQNT
jgi:hypothetical protein